MSVESESAIVSQVLSRYRRGELTHHQVTEALNISWYEVEDLFKRHNVTEDLITAEELAEQVADLRRHFGA